MGHASTVIRPARPDSDEGRAYAGYLDMAAEGFIRFMYGPECERIISEAFIQPQNDYSFENAVVAERAGEIAGMASGFTAARRRGFSDRPLMEAAGPAARRIKLVRFLFAPIMRIISTVGEGDFYVLAIALDRELRGEGIGSMLMDAMEERAREAGASRLSLDVAHGNAGARGFYERRGMTVESQWPKRLPVTKITFYRMVKTL